MSMQSIQVLSHTSAATVAKAAGRSARQEEIRVKRQAEIAEAIGLGVEMKPRPVKCDLAWTPEEDDTCRRMYPNYQSMLNVLRHRTYDSLKQRCRSLGLTPVRHVWTTREEALLRSVWKLEKHDIRAAFPNISFCSIKGKARHLGLPVRGTPPLVLTGNWLCDAVRDRCRELGYTMTQLDQLALTGRYFQKALWLQKRGHRWWPLIKAAKMLGGELRVEWPD